MAPHSNRGGVPLMSEYGPCGGLYSYRSPDWWMRAEDVCGGAVCGERAARRDKLLTANRALVSTDVQSLAWADGSGKQRLRRSLRPWMLRLLAWTWSGWLVPRKRGEAT